MQQADNEPSHHSDDDDDLEMEEEVASKDEERLLFPCPEPGCTKIYQSQARLDRHLDEGKHAYKPERVSLRDAAIGAYKQELEGLRIPTNLPSIGEALQPLLTSQDTNSPMLQMGWALRERRQGGPFDPAVRAYLSKKFKDAPKSDPKVIAKKLRSEFPPDTWVTWRQIASFWSRLARLQRQESLDDLEEEEENEEPQQQADPALLGNEEDLEGDAYFNNIERNIRDAIEDNEGDIFQQE